MFIINLKQSTILSEHAEPVKGEVIHVKALGDLKKHLTHEQAKAVHDNNVATSDALPADVAPEKAFKELWQLLQDNPELNLARPKAEKHEARRGRSASAARAKAESRKPKGKKGGGSRAGSFQPAAHIKVLAKENPKRQGSAAFKRFGLYGRCKTVEEFLKRGGTTGDLRYDTAAGFIKVA